MANSKSTPDTPKINSEFILIAIGGEDNILHKTFSSLEEINPYVSANIEDSDDFENGALVFVINGILVPESEWRLPDNKSEIYWTVV